LAQLKADVIFHPAAYKHVPMMEENPVAAIHNNFFGIDNLISAAKKHKVKRFVYISTDKAVEPVSVYGVSKYLCEELALEAAATSSSFMVVRFGNVLASRGSIIPIFQKQIEKGGPVTITHPDMQRWFMTIPEACSLVLKAGGVGENGRIYLLDMGEPVKIKDLAEQMIRFYGLIPNEDIKIEYIGLRKGERLDEKLLWEFEKAHTTDHERILKVDRSEMSELNINAIKEELLPICEFDPAQGERYRNSELLRSILRDFVPSYAASYAAHNVESCAHSAHSAAVGK
jgi:FlaA1/EpsC-like NDP-sugar epimerase